LLLELLMLLRLLRLLILLILLELLRLMAMLDLARLTVNSASCIRIPLQPLAEVRLNWWKVDAVFVVAMPIFIPANCEILEVLALPLRNG
jgi:hypothetical protein